MNRGPEYAAELTPAEQAMLDRLVRAQGRSWRGPIAAGVLTVLVLAGAFLLKPAQPAPPQPSALAQLAAAAPALPSPVPKHELAQRTLETTVTGTSGRCLAGAVIVTLSFTADGPPEAKVEVLAATTPARLPGCDPQRTKTMTVNQPVRFSGDVAASWEALRSKWAIGTLGLGLPPYTDPRVTPELTAADPVTWWADLAALLASPQLDPGRATAALRTAAKRADADGVTVVAGATTDLTGRQVFTVRVPGGLELSFEPSNGALRQRIIRDGATRHITTSLAG